MTRSPEDLAPRLVRPPLRTVRSYIFDSAGWDGFDVRADDIIIATYPKCGTTWVQRIVGMLIFQSAAPFPVQESSPWPDFRGMPREVTRAIAAGQTHRRFLKTHLPFDALPVYAGVKLIHVAREGRDAAMSFHNHLTSFTPGAREMMAAIGLADPKFGAPPPESEADPADFFRGWVAGVNDEHGDPGAGFFAVEKSYWDARHEPDVLLVHYNDLTADLGGEMRRIAHFLGIGVPDALWPDLEVAATFSAMKRDASDLMPTAGMIWDGGGDRFLHKGTNGRWRDVVHARDLALYEAKVAAEFTPALAAWLAGGRLIAGDPVQMPD